MKKKLILFVLVIPFMVACSTTEKANLGTFDVKKFSTDRGACEGQRTTQIEELKSLEKKILGLSENQVLEAFGRYDYQILDRRSQKIFVFFLEKGPHCNNIQEPSQALEMVLYFNAVSLVREVSFRTGNPAE
jgi:hypothetical protein